MFFFKKMKPLPLCLSLSVTGQMEVMALHSKLEKQFLLKEPRLLYSYPGKRLDGVKDI